MPVFRAVGELAGRFCPGITNVDPPMWTTTDDRTSLLQSVQEIICQTTDD